MTEFYKNLGYNAYYIMNNVKSMGEDISNANNKKEKKYISNNEKFNDMLIDYLESI